MQHTRYARGPDGKTHGFHPGWRQERRLLRSVHASVANAALREQLRAGVRTPFPPPLAAPDRAGLEHAQPRGARDPSGQAVGDNDDDTGEIFLLNDSVATMPVGGAPAYGALGGGAPTGGRPSPPTGGRPSPPPASAREASSAHLPAFAVSKPSASELTEQLRAMCGLVAAPSTPAGTHDTAALPPALAVARTSQATQRADGAAKGWLPLRTAAMVAAEPAAPALPNPPRSTGAGDCAVGAPAPTASEMSERLRALCGIGAFSSGPGSARSGALSPALSAPPSGGAAPAPRDTAAPRTASVTAAAADTTAPPLRGTAWAHAPPGAQRAATAPPLAPALPARPQQSAQNHDMGGERNGANGQGPASDVASSAHLKSLLGIGLGAEL
ncbi:hypothetical protein KFE25_000973 [Diacronema lutheri]|uniref:Uncharacterized protein n=1 Tax=Diacronema lutheri TaxID=2081491 RepID=A0A8J5XF25_DIALT|nr:hypothetical protein KFE25_000973 [Diacronema lutheri]